MSEQDDLAAIEWKCKNAVSMIRNPADLLDLCKALRRAWADRDIALVNGESLLDQLLDAEGELRSLIGACELWATRRESSDGDARIPQSVKTALDHARASIHAIDVPASFVGASQKMVDRYEHP